MACRKNLTRLTAAERQAFVNAVLELKANGGYDTYVQQHLGAGGHGHQGPAFFPWHREYLRRFELDLQEIDSSVAVPYWDWTVENLNSAGTASRIWSDDLMGGPGDAGNNFAVTTGPFAGWGLRRNAFNIFQSPGGGGAIANFMSNPNYTTFRGIEGPHGGAHVWVGGHMGNVAQAPEDPVFWLLHCNVDRLWAEWTHSMQGNPGWVQYAPTSGGPTGHNLNDTMWPWNGTTSPFGMSPWTIVPENVRPSDLLDHRAIDTQYDTIDPPCQRVAPKLPDDIKIKDRLPKELGNKELKEPIKDRLPKELVKDRLPKEIPDKLEIKDRGPKEPIKDRSPKEVKEDLKELKEPIKDRGPKEIEIPGQKHLPEDVFIRPELRPGLETAALNFEPDVAAEIESLQARAEELRRRQGGQ